VCCAGAPQDHDSGDQREDHDAGRTGFRLAVDRASHPLRRIVADPGASIALPLGNKERDPAREQGGVAGDVGWLGGAPASGRGRLQRQPSSFEGGANREHSSVHWEPTIASRTTHRSRTPSDSG
jgi:hypothetical protein